MTMDFEVGQQHELFEHGIPRIAAATLKDGGAAFELNSYRFLKPMDICHSQNIQTGQRFCQEQSI